jgi:diaminopimelate decarboxylase
VDTLHVHLGWGLRAVDAPLVRSTFARLAEAARRVPALRAVNVGGGLGARLQERDRPLPLETWVEALADHLAPLGVEIACEPGTFLVADAGLLVAQVAVTWDKNGTHWAGLDAGHALNVYAAHYGLPLEILHAARPLEPPSRRWSVAGNINESGDVFAQDRPLPPLAEGDLVALYPTGAYGASMASDHCLRGQPRELLEEMDGRVVVAS